MYTCLVKSLTASLIGCKSPIRETLLGPTRFCLNLKILRSSRVIKATLMSTKITQII